MFSRDVPPDPVNDVSSSNHACSVQKLVYNNNDPHAVVYNNGPHAVVYNNGP